MSKVVAVKKIKTTQPCVDVNRYKGGAGMSRRANTHLQGETVRRVGVY